jgi:hypothetical protein
VQKQRENTVKNRMTMTGALEMLRTSQRGQCCGCGNTAGSWSETMSGTSGDNPVVWPGCYMHHTATGTPIPARAYALCAAEAKRRGLTVDGLWEALNGVVSPVYSWQS